MPMTALELPDAYRLTFKDWLAFPDNGLIYEIIAGELFVTPPPNIRHQRISRDLEYELIGFFKRTGRGEILDAPVGVRLAEDTIVEPDLVVILTEHSDRIGEQVISGPPDIVVEVLSPGTAGRDLSTKRDAYAAAGVPEYWIVDPDARHVDVLVLTATGNYRRFGQFRAAGTLRSSILPGLEIPLEGIL